MFEIWSFETYWNLALEIRHLSRAAPESFTNNAGYNSRVSETLLESFRGSDLLPLAEKVAARERLTFGEGVILFTTRDFLGVGRLANFVREREHGNAAYFNVNRYLNPTNLCWVDCALCAWAKKVNEPGGYEMGIEECLRHAREGYTEAVTEFHIVGGLHPYWPFEYYTNLLSTLKERFPGVHLEGVDDGRDRLDRHTASEGGPRAARPSSRSRRKWGSTRVRAAAPRSSRGGCGTSICKNKISGERGGSRSPGSATRTASARTRRSCTGIGRDRGRERGRPPRPPARAPGRDGRIHGP